LADILDETQKIELRKYWKESKELSLIFNPPKADKV